MKTKMSMKKMRNGEMKKDERIWYWAHPTAKGYAEIMKVTEIFGREPKFEVIDTVPEYEEAVKICRELKYQEMCKELL